MVNRTIAIGETSSFRYFGIEPPLDDGEIEQIITNTILPEWIIFDQFGCTQEPQGDGPAHTELGLEVGQALDSLGRETVDPATVKIAHQISTILQKNGDIVTVLDGILPTDWRTPLFGEWAKDTREWQQSRKQPED
jgi:hypothetical protein